MYVDLYIHKCPACNACQEPCGDRMSLARNFSVDSFRHAVRVDHPRMTFLRPDKAYEAVALYPSYILIPCSGYISPALPFDFFSPIHLNSPVHAIGTSRCRDVQSYS